MELDAEEMVQRRLHLARAQGDAYEEAVHEMIATAAFGGAERRAGGLWVGYAAEPARGTHEWEDGELVFREPREGEIHLRVMVRDAADGRFIPGATVSATLIDPEGRSLGTAIQRLLWDPVFYHYGADWPSPVPGPHRLRVLVQPPPYPCHGPADGWCLSPGEVEVEFGDVFLAQTR